MVNRRQKVRLSLGLGAAASTALLVACTVATAPQLIDRSIPGETEPVESTRVVAVYTQPDATTAIPYGPRIALEKELTRHEVAVLREAERTVYYSWQPGNTTAYIVLDVLVVPRLVGGFFFGILWGSGIVKAEGTSASRTGSGGIPREAFYHANPFIDFFGRLFGSGLRREVGERRRSEFAVPPPMQESYWINLVDWFGWFVPGYPVMSSAVAEDRVEEVPLRPIQGAEVPGTRVVMLSGERLPLNIAEEQYRMLVDDSPIEQLTAGGLVLAEGGSITVDLASWLKREKWVRRGSDDAKDPAGNSRHAFALRVFDKQGAELPLRNQANESIPSVRDVGELNVTWRVPENALPPQRVTAQIVLLDKSDSEPWLPGEQVRVRLTLTNQDEIEAWNLTPVLHVPTAALSGELDVSAPSPASLERLNPGESASFDFVVASREDWIWPENQIEIAASAGNYQAPAVEIRTLSNREPELAIAALAWEEFEDSRDGIIRPGETFSVRITALNRGGGQARDARVVLEGPGFRAKTTDEQIDYLATGAAANFRFQVRMPEDAAPVALTQSTVLPDLKIRLEERNPRFTTAFPLTLTGKKMFNRPLDVLLSELEP